MISVDDTYRNAIRLHQQGRALEAGQLYDEILAISPDHYGALHLKGVLALQAGEVDRAIDLIRRSLKAQPEHALALANLGVALRLAKRFEGAVTALRQAVKLDANLADAWANLSMLEARTGAVREAIASGRRALSLRPNFPGLDASLLFAENYLAENDPVEAAQRARVLGDAMQREASPRTEHANDPDAARRLKVGLVSSDLRAHPVGRFLDATLAQLDPDAIELYAYAGGEGEDDLTTSLKRSVPHWLDASGFTDGELGERIVADKIDVLVDLNGHTQGNRLAVFAGKPAPVAFTWLGYFATTGLTSIDYVLANRQVITPGEEGQWIERVWRLPETHLCFSTPKQAPAVSPLPAAGTGHITFGSFNNFNKLSDATLKAWSQLLQLVPDSRLVLRSPGRVAPGLSSRLAGAGIKSARVRVEETVADYTVHLAGYNDIDIALDCFPYNGGTTTVEALYMGVPVLVRAGDRYVAHMGESFLHEAGLDDWIAGDEAAFAALGAAKAGDIAALAVLRAGLRDRVAASPLFDAPRFAGQLQEAIRGMWQNWCAAQRRE